MYYERMTPRGDPPLDLDGFDRSLVRWSEKSASKHGVSEDDARLVLSKATTYFREPSQDFRMVWGRSQTGQPLEVGIVPWWPEGVEPVGDPVAWVIVHAMEAQEPYLSRIQIRGQKR